MPSQRGRERNLPELACRASTSRARTPEEPITGEVSDRHVHARPLLALSLSLSLSLSTTTAPTPLMPALALSLVVVMLEVRTVLASPYETR